MNNYLLTNFNKLWCKLLKQLLILFIFFVFVTISHAKKEHFKVAYDPDYAPFSYNQANKPHGLLIDIWKLWAKQNNYTIEFIDGKLWDDALELVKNKEVDFFLGTEVYEDWMYGSKEIYKAQTSLFKLNSNKKNFNKFAKVKIGIIGEDYKEYIKGIFTNSEIFIYEDYKTIFDDLINNKIDLVYDDALAIKFFTLENRLFHLIHAIDKFSIKSPIQAISHNEELKLLFDKGLNKLNTKDLLEIEKKWILNDALQYDNKSHKKGINLSEEEKEFLKNHSFNISISQSWRPFAFYNNGEADGISSDFWKYFSKDLGLQSNYNFSKNFTDQLNSIKDRSNDLIFSTGRTKDREEYSIFTKPYISFPISIATLKDENFIEDASLLLDKKVAVGKNFTAHKMLKIKYPDMNFIFVKSILEGLEKVSNKEAYAYVDIKPNLMYNINKQGLKDIKITGNTGLNFELRIMIRDDYPLLLSALNKSIDNMNIHQKNNIVAKWSNIQFEEKNNYSLAWKILAFVMLIIVALIYRSIVIERTNNTLKRTIDERTKELKTLNENLEKIVKEKTKELTEINESLDEAQKIANLGSYKYDVNKNELYWSDEHYKIFGVNPKETSPSFGLYLSTIHPDDKEKVLKQIDYTQRTNRTLKFEYRLLLDGEKIKYVESTSRRKLGTDGKISLIIGTILDITSLKTLEFEKRQQENLLAQQSKMAAMGEMLENIAHQWRQPLSLISTCSSSIKLHKEMDMLRDDFLYEYINKITEASQYLSKTIDDFRNFFSSDKKVLEFDIKDMVEKCLLILSSKMDNREVEVIYNTTSVQVKSLESELIQVVMNLIKNAIDVVENQKGKKLIFIDIFDERNLATIKIRDNGGGIDESIMERVFEPYFTTKHKAQGTGIGLYMSLEIMTKHIKGDMKVRNVEYCYEEEDCKGAEFIIYLPKDIS